MSIQDLDGFLMQFFSLGSEHLHQLDERGFHVQDTIYVQDSRIYVLTG